MPLLLIAGCGAEVHADVLLLAVAGLRFEGIELQHDPGWVLGLRLGLVLDGVGDEQDEEVTGAMSSTIGTT